MKHSDILKDPHFNNLAAIIRVPTLSQTWREEHLEVPFWTLLDELSDVKTEEAFATNRQEFVIRFRRFLVTLTTADSRLAYTEDDLAWFVQVMDGQHALVIASLLLAWSSAPDTLLTPAEIAAATGTAESTWRNKAAAGAIPGAVKKGKQWLLPRSVLRSQGLNL
jgi:hypothetical protein